MNDIYEAPKSEFISTSNTYIKPNRILIDITFWIAHIGLIVSMILAPPSYSEEPMPSSSVYLFAIAAISILIYYFSIGIFAKKMGRSAIVWGLGSFLLSPVTIWITYIASFIVKPK